MAFRIESIDEADVEFLGLPPSVREIFIAAFRELAVSETPIVQGPGWYVEELRQNQRIVPEGLFSLHVGGLWRGAFCRTRGSLVFIGFGYRIPEFYDKLTRLSKTVRETRK
ncbi:MAG: hypothetical protein WAN87_03660 [Thermoplasmata archaeon]